MMKTSTNGYGTLYYRSKSPGRRRILQGVGLLLCIFSQACLATVCCLGAESPPAAAPASGSAAGMAARLDNSTLPGAGRQTTVLTVDRFGGYAIIAESRQGVALQLNDHMTGPSALVGKTGKQDGRFYQLLDRGSYQVVTYGHELAVGDVKLSVHPFKDINADNPVQLAEFKLVQTELKDLQEASYWIEIPKGSKLVLLEAAGRCLSDLRLWRDGAWLTEDQPVTATAEPSVGHPLSVCKLSAKLEAGIYKVVAYGGPPQPWATAAEESPLYVRYGIPKGHETARQLHHISPLGYDYYLVPGSATYYRLELPEKRPVKFDVSLFNEETPFAEEQAAAEGEGGDQASATPEGDAEPPAEPDAGDEAAGEVTPVPEPEGEPVAEPDIDTPETAEEKLSPIKEKTVPEAANQLYRVMVTGALTRVLRMTRLMPPPSSRGERNKAAAAKSSIPSS